jgi:hypothetical protein
LPRVLANARSAALSVLNALTQVKIAQFAVKIGVKHLLALHALNESSITALVQHASPATADANPATRLDASLV